MASRVYIDARHTMGGVDVIYNESGYVDVCVRLDGQNIYVVLSLADAQEFWSKLSDAVARLARTKERG